MSCIFLSFFLSFSSSFLYPPSDRHLRDVHLVLPANSSASFRPRALLVYFYEMFVYKIGYHLIGYPTLCTIERPILRFRMCFFNLGISKGSSIKILYGVFTSITFIGRPTSYIYTVIFSIIFSLSLSPFLAVNDPRCRN